jgi:hypothetical protein
MIVPEPTVKLMFRCTFKFTEARFAHVGESNIFLRAFNIELGEKLARDTFRLKMIAAHVPEDSPYDFTIKPSSDMEAILYAQQKATSKWVPGTDTKRASN